MNPQINHLVAQTHIAELHAAADRHRLLRAGKPERRPGRRGRVLGRGRIAAALRVGSPAQIATR